MKTSRKLLYLTPICALLAAGSAQATNGMLMEGYGPISTGMGGTSQAVDHGTAAMAQNPATLGLMADGSGRLDLAIGILGPDISSSVPGMPSAKSGGTSYLMPAVGYVRRSGAFTYGVGMFAQGGMGTEYDATSFLAMGSGEKVRSELGVGNLIFPFAYQLSPNVTLGATLKYIWSSLDMLLAASPAQLGQMATGGSGALGGAIGAGALNTANWARINFSDDNKFTGAASATGFGATLGATFKVSNAVMLGTSYQLKSRLSDMKTGSNAASMTASTGFADNGQITVIDFQMPAVFAIGASWQANPSLLLAADLKSIGWADSMQSFKMRYDSAQMGGSVSFAMPQNWEDQTVLNLGMAWKANDQLTLRAGLNLAANPVPDMYVNPLFPAIEQNHVTLGMGYKVSAAGDFNASLTLAPSVSVNSGSGPAISHSQRNMQLMYSHRF